MLSNKIKFETFCAFIHSRFVGIGVCDDKTEEAIFTNKNDTVYLDEKGKPIIDYLASIGTLETINKKISESKSALISSMYHDNYSKLLKLMENKIKDGDDVIMSVVGVGMLIDYMENDKYEKTINIDLKDLMDIYFFFELKSDKHLKLVRNMMKISAYVVENYWNDKNKIKRKRKTK